MEKNQKTMNEIIADILNNAKNNVLLNYSCDILSGILKDCTNLNESTKIALESSLNLLEKDKFKTNISVDCLKCYDEITDKNFRNMNIFEFANNGDIDDVKLFIDAIESKIIDLDIAMFYIDNGMIKDSKRTKWLLKSTSSYIKGEKEIMVDLLSNIRKILNTRKENYNG